jgi:hypothetical protein
MNQPKYMNPIVKRIAMPQAELKSMLISYQSRLWNHMTERNSNNINHGYVDMLERNIKEIKSMLTQPANKAA